MGQLGHEQPLETDNGPARPGGAVCIWKAATMETPEPLSSLLRRFGDDGRPVPRIKFAVALARGDDPFNLLPYLAGLGRPVKKIDDLLVINDDPDEEELHSFQVAEGIAVSIASDGLWLLFER